MIAFEFMISKATPPLELSWSRVVNNESRSFTLAVTLNCAESPGQILVGVTVVLSMAGRFTYTFLNAVSLHPCTSVKMSWYSVFERGSATGFEIDALLRVLLGLHECVIGLLVTV